MEAHPENDVFLADASNAFNSSSKLKALEEAHKYFPQMTPFLMKLYYEDSFGCYFGLKVGLQKIPSVEGKTQGCKLGSWLWCMANQPFLKGLANILLTNSAHTSGALKSFIDDTNLDRSYFLYPTRRPQNWFRPQLVKRSISPCAMLIRFGSH